MRHVLAVLFTCLSASPALADPLSCALDGYRSQEGLTAASAGDALTLAWTGDHAEQVRLRFTLDAGVPTIDDLSVRAARGAWATIVAGVRPEYHLAAGLRRMSNQQMVPLRNLGVGITDEVLDAYRWDPFWDAPLDLGPAANRSSNPPPAAGVAGQPGLPRRPGEITRASAEFQVTRCEVHTVGQRIEVRFPGVRLGMFEGRLQYTVFKGSSLIQQDIVATTARPWVAYKYHAGLAGLRVAPATRVVWRDIANSWQENRLGGAPNTDDVPLKAANRLVAAQTGTARALALFPPPHTYFWAREIAINLGYNYVRKGTDGRFAFGVRQAEKEHESENPANFALYSARPGTEQRMTLFLYAAAASGEATIDRALAFTHGDRYTPLPGYQVMNHHYHMDLGRRLGEEGSLDADIPDLVALKALGINIVSQVDSVGLGGEGTPAGAVYRGPGQPAATPPPARDGAPGTPAAPGAPAARPRVDELQIRYNSIEGAKRHSDTTFLVLPSQEYYGSPLGGHTDLIFSHPVYWEAGRAAGQSLTETHPKYGTVYRIGGAADLMEMARREGVLITMPHPRTKGSTGYPDAVRDLPFFAAAQYHGIGFRWGMGLDRSEQRLCEYRCLPLLDDMSNWMADRPGPLKYALSISEVRHQQPGDDIYASAPVTYVKLDALPPPDDAAALVGALQQGAFFVTSGEVLIPSWRVAGTGGRRTVEADVEWSFPLAMVEVVWGDGVTTGRTVIAASDLPASGTHHFSIPFDATGRKWVRFAAWDVAGNGAFVQPVRLER